MPVGEVKLILSCMMIFVLVMVMPAVASAMTPDTADDINKMIQEQMDEAKIPHVSVGIVQGDEISYLSYVTSQMKIPCIK